MCTGANYVCGDEWPGQGGGRGERVRVHCVYRDEWRVAGREDESASECGCTDTLRASSGGGGRTP